MFSFRSLHGGKIRVKTSKLNRICHAGPEMSQRQQTRTTTARLTIPLSFGSRRIQIHSKVTLDYMSTHSFQATIFLQQLLFRALLKSGEPGERRFQLGDSIRTAASDDR
mmetsp:Transcript_20285/g.67670  ORF Transcript_20285/g.67670 Transcript_20285/m.67670 type:complete len:109 (+) Transcript_20285:1533-1859(+)